MNLNISMRANNSATWPTMELSLSKDPPDLLGFAEVSGFYGPGTWSAWFLTVAASWVHLVTSDNDSKWDVNLCTYLLGLNWAASDLLRHASRLSALYAAGSEDRPWSKEVASLGAALTMVFWGCFHAVSQLLLCDLLSDRRFKRAKSILTPGLMLPSISIVLAGYYLLLCGTDKVIDVLPALYWKVTQASSNRNIAVEHGYLLFWAYMISIGGCIYSVGSMAYSVRHLLLLLVRWVSRSAGAIYVADLWRKIVSYRLVRRTTIFLSFVFLVTTSLILLLLFFSILVLVPVALVFLVLSLYMFFVTVLLFVVAYLGGGLSVSESCFFMPCSPYSILETDQAGSLFAGLFLFVGVEILLPGYDKLKKSYRENRQFEQSFGRTVTTTAMRRVVQDATIMLMGSDGLFPSTQRVNSGIALEEGISSGSRIPAEDNTLSQDDTAASGPTLLRRATLGLGSAEVLEGSA